MLHVESVRDVQLNNYVRVRGVRVKCGVHGRKNLGAVGSAILETCKKGVFCVFFVGAKKNKN